MTNVFRPTDADDTRTHYLYRLFDRDGVLLYIGVTTDVEQRVYMHLQTFTAAHSFLIHMHYARHTVEGPFPDKASGRRAEAAAIRAEGPAFNHQHNPKRWRRSHRGWAPVGDPYQPPARTAEELASAEATRAILRDSLAQFSPA